VGAPVLIGRQTIAGYGLGMVRRDRRRLGLSVWGRHGVKLELNNFTRLLFYYLFMYGVGLRVGPPLNSLGGDGTQVHLSGSARARARLIVVARTVRPAGGPAAASRGLAIPQRSLRRAGVRGRGHAAPARAART
jgi:putative transport protein